MSNFRYIGASATDLDGGRPLAPGDFTGDIDVSEDSPKNKHLLDDGLLIEAPDGVETEEQKAETEFRENREREEATDGPQGKEKDAKEQQEQLDKTIKKEEPIKEGDGE